jgi:HSP20 family molecular chaperone IbpA
MSTKTKEIQKQDVEKQEVEVSEGTERTRPGKAFVPRADIYETDGSLVIVTDMPGVDKNTVDITLEKNILTLKGLVEFTAPNNYSLAFAEYEVGDYERSFTLSSEIDRDNIEASIKDGVLKITLPKVAQSTKKVEVKAA